jgi:hypothetical protein
MRTLVPLAGDKRFAALAPIAFVLQIDAFFDEGSVALALQALLPAPGEL